MKRLFALLFLLPVLAFGEGSEAIKVGTQTRDVLSPLTINWTGTTLNFTGASVSGLSGTGVTLKTNGTTNGSQTLLNLVAGSNISLTDNGVGSVTIATSGGGTVTSVDISGSNGISSSGGPVTSSGTIALSLPFTLASGTTGKTLTVNNNITLAGTDGSTLNIAGGGTLGSNAFTSTAYVPTSRTLTIGPTTSDLSANRTFLASVTDDAQTKASIVPNTVPSAGQILAGNTGGTAYAPVTLSGSGATATLSDAGVLTLSGIANATLSNSAITIAGTSTALGGSITLDTISGVSSNGFLKRTGTNTWTNDSSTYLTGNQTITLSGDATGSGTTAITVTNVNLPTGVTQAGYLAATAIAAPGTPASGLGRIYVDSTSKNLALKDDAGTVKHGVQTKASATSNFLTAINDAGLVSAAQPTATDVGLASVTNDAQTKASIVPNTAPSAGQILAGNAGGTAYAPVTLSGSGATATLSSAGVLTLSAIPNATLSNSAITIAGTSTSLGGSITLDTISGVSSNGFLKRTSANTWTNDSSTYLTSAVTSVATTSPITGGTITGTGTIALDVSVDHAFTAAQGITLTNATTNATDTVLTLSHDSSGTAAASFGEGILLRLQDNTTANQNAAQISTAWSIATHATHASYIDFQASTGGAALASVARLFGSGGFSVNSTTDPGAGIINANTGFEVAAAAASGNYLRGDGTKFVSNTIQSGDVPTLNQNTTGSAASLSISGQSGLLTFTGLTSTNRAKTVRDAADTVLELGGSYTPTGTWTSLTMVTPVLGTPTSGTMTNVTGTADGLTAGDVTRNHAIYAAASPPTVDVGIFVIQKTSINLGSGTSNAGQDVFTVPSGRTFVCTQAYLKFTTISGASAGAMTVEVIESGSTGIMFNGGGAASSSFTPATNGGFHMILGSQQIFSCAAGNKVQVRVVSAQASTTLTATVYITGYYTG